jgi:hydrophobic/amphiphilic exporter-1 (mainly G- bacteria), HAE1 family
LFLGSVRATFAVLLSIPLSALAAFVCIRAGGGSIDTMVLAGLALAFSRLIDNSVVVLENIFRHLEMGETPEVAAEVGGKEVQLAVLAATFTTAIVFFPVALLYGVSRYLFTALALTVVFALFASYMVAMTVVPLYCARFIKSAGAEREQVAQLDDTAAKFAVPRRSFFQRIVGSFNSWFQRMLEKYVVVVNRSMLRPVATTFGILGAVLLSFALFPFLGRSYFPRTDPGQFVINIRCPSGTRIELSNRYVAQVEQEIREVVSPRDLDMIVSNIGITPDLSAIYTSNSSMDTAFVQVSLKEGHKVGSYEYMARVRRKLADDMPQLATYFQAGGLVDSVINQGLPAPIDVQVSGNDMDQSYAIANQIAAKVKNLKNVSDVLIPQNLRYPGLALNIDRERASLIGLSPKEIVDNVITALTSNGMIAPSYWIDPKTGNNYMLTVQYFDQKIAHMSMDDFKQIPLRAENQTSYTPLQSVANIKEINTPTEVDHYQIRRVIDVYVMPSTEALQRVNGEVHQIIAAVQKPKNVRITVRGTVVSMNESFFRFGVGLILSIALVYLILMAQFASFVDPFIILMAIPPGLSGVLIILLLTGSTLNVMSLMGVIMMTGIVVSNSILIVEFAGHLHEQGLAISEAVVQSCKIRLRPILMTSLATLLGMIPMALGLEAGSEQYAPLARAIIGGLGVSVIATVFLVPAVYLIIHRRYWQTPARQEESTHA